MKIFISHISEEQPLASVIKKRLNFAFPRDVDVFVSSDPDDIPPGAKWLDKISKAMECSNLLIILYSDHSKFRPWINFEAGCGWIKKIPIIPICHSGLKVSQLESPISTFQGLDIESIDFTKVFFGTVAKLTEFEQSRHVPNEEFMREVKSAIDSIKYKVIENVSPKQKNEISKEQENKDAITTQATTGLNEKTKLEKVDKDWIAYFYDKCKNVSDKDMQGLWSKILAGEANAPGTYSKRTLELVYSLEKKEADLFTKLCGFAIGPRNDMMPLILDINDEIYSKAGLSFVNMAQLETIGFIKFDNTTEFSVQNMPKEAIVNYYGIKFKFEFRKDSGNNLPVGKVILTKSGNQLTPICGSEMNPEFIEYAMEYYNNKKNLTGDVVSMTIVE